MWASGALYAGLGGGTFFVMAAISALACGFGLLLQAINPRGQAAPAA